MKEAGVADFAYDKATEQLGYVQILEGDPDVFGTGLTFVLDAIMERGWRVAKLALSALQSDQLAATHDYNQVAQIVFVGKRDSGEFHLKMGNNWGPVIKWGP
jgi:hypothetical protein